MPGLQVGLGLRFRQGQSRWRGVQIAEFALVLPLLVTMAIAVMDFGAATNMKQKISNAAREGARFAASQPILDVNIQGGGPPSLNAVNEVVFDYLANARVLPNAGQGSCALGGAATQISGDGASTWTYSYAGCPNTLTVVIARNYTIGTTSQGVLLLGTDVKVSYPYTWQLGHVIGLIAPGSTLFSGSSTMTSEAVMPNLY